MGYQTRGDIVGKFPNGKVGKSAVKKPKPASFSGYGIKSASGKLGKGAVTGGKPKSAFKSAKAKVRGKR